MPMEQSQVAAATDNSEHAAFSGEPPIRWISADFLQNDITRSNDFRKEYYKYCLTIATALLAFTVSFPPNLIRVDGAGLIVVAWTGLGSAVIAGVLVHYLWARFFISFRDHDNHGDASRGKSVRRRITLARRWMDGIQLAGLAIGVVCIVAFAGTNLKNIALKDNGTKASTAGTAAPSSGPTGASSKSNQGSN